MQKILSIIFISLFSSTAFADQAALLVYKVWEQGAEPYFSRVLVTDDFVRLDEGIADDGFTLFDRKKRVIYNVSNEEHTILVIAPTLEKVAESKMLVLSEKVEEDKKAPMIAGKTPQNIELLANAESCSHLVVVPGLMEPALAGLRDFKKVLARVQAATISAQPIELQTACDLATNIYAPTRALDYGLPVQERGAGRSQSLIDFQARHEVDAALFELPKDYEHTSMQTLPSLG